MRLGSPSACETRLSDSLKEKSASNAYALAP
jgi:hypothetical protein